MRKLIINGHIADLDDNEIIALSKESNAIFDFQNKRSNISNKIKLPKSHQNNIIFGSAEDITSVLRYDNINKRNWYDVQYIQDYQEIIKSGKAILNNAKQYYEFTIYWGNIDIKDKLKDATLKDLNLLDLDHDYSVENTIIREGVLADSEYFYPLTNNVKDQPMLSGLDSDNAIDVVPLVPAVRLSRILKQITKDYHIFYSGIQDIEANDNIIIQTNERKLPEILSEDVEDKYFLGQNVINTGQTNEEKFNIKIGDLDYHILPETGKYELTFNFSVEFDRLRRNSSLLIGKNKFQLDTLIFAELYQSGTWQEYSTHDAALTAIENGDTLGSRMRIFRDQIFERDLQYEQIFSTKRIFNFQENDRIRWRCISKVVDDSTFITGTGFIHNYYIDSGSRFNVGYEKLIEGMPIKMSQSMPDVKLVGLLKYIASMTGRLIDFPDGGNTIKYVSIEDFVNNIHNAYKLTDNIESIEIEDLHCGLAQSNIMKYNNHGEIPEMLGGGTFNIEDNTLTTVKEFYKAPFSASVNENWRDWRVASIPLAEFQEDVADKDGSIDNAGDRILDARIVETDIFYDFYGTIANLTFKKYIASFPESLSYQEIIQTRYRQYINVMNDYKFIKARAYLTSSEFSEIDLMQPVYIKQLGGYFIINKIHNYVEGRLTELHMTMLSYPVRPVTVITPPVLPPPPPLTKALSLTVRDNGRVVIDGDIYLTGSYTIFVELDKQITLNGVADELYQFYKWTGDVESSSAEIQVTMDTEKALEAWFTLPRIKLEDSTGHILTEDGTYIFLE